MKNLFLAISLLFGGFIFANAQQATPTPNPSEEARRIVRQNQEINRRFEAMRNGGNRNPNLVRQISRQNIEPLYRKTTDKELKLLAPNRIDVEKFAEFLRQPNIGITKLAADFGCAENTNVVVASEDCLKYTMPGAGSSYSFRVKNYRIRRLADITFTDNSFQATGVLLHGIFVNIGDAALENVSLDTEGLKFLTEFKPEPDFEKAKQIDLQLATGIEKDGFLYRRALYAKDNTTYVLRSIAYNGSFYRAVQNIAYNELAFDKRKDVIVAFRIVRRDADGSVTILWKQLTRNNSPKVKRNLKATETKVKKTDFTAIKK